MQLTKFRFNLVAATLAASAFVAACGGGSAGAPALTTQTALVSAASLAYLSPSATTALSTTGGSGTGAVTYAVASGTCTVSGNTLTAPAAAGTCTVTATKAADATYAAATSAAIAVAVTVPVVVVQNQTAAQDSYVAATSVSLPGNNTTGGYEGSTSGGYWWGQVGTDSVYRGTGIAVADVGSYLGVYVAGAGATTWSISTMNLMTVGLGTNAECVGICKATIILKNNNSCSATLNTPITILTNPVNTGTSATQVAGAVPSYTAALTDANWTVAGCATDTMTAFKALPLKEVHAQLLRANMQTTTLANMSVLYPNGINLGGIKFN